MTKVGFVKYLFLKDYVSYKKYHKKQVLQRKKKKNNHIVRVITHGIL